MAAMTWDQYLKFLMDVEKENVEENYRIGRGANDADEAMNGDTRDGFAALQEMMPTLLAAPELLAVLRDCTSELIDLYEQLYPDDESDNDTTAVIDRAIAAIATAEGRDE